MNKKGKEDKQYIHIKGARVHNLKNIEVKIPHEQLVVVTGLSGSGKSTLAFDTIFAEGQRRYVESLSAYARQFLGRLDKPDVDFITGIAPAIAIQQRVNTRNPRSTVGTSTEIYDYLKLLFARIGRIYSPVSGDQVRAYQVADVVDYVYSLGEGERVLIVAPVSLRPGQGMIERLTVLISEGFQRIYRGGRAVLIEDVLPELAEEAAGNLVEVVVDRLKVGDTDEQRTRVSDSIATAYSMSDGVVRIIRDVPGNGTAACPVRQGQLSSSSHDGIPGGDAGTLPVSPEDTPQYDSGSSQPSMCEATPVRNPKTEWDERSDTSPQEMQAVPGHPREREFSNRLEADGIVFEHPSEHLFSFNNPLGACPRCEGYGKVIGIDEELVVPDKSRSIYENAIACWRGDTMKWWKDQLVNNAHKFDFPVHTPYYDLSREQKQLLWTGNRHFKGLDDFFGYLEGERYKIQYRVMLARYKGKTVCGECGGSRLRKEALYVKVGGLNISQMVVMPVERLYEFFAELRLDDHDRITGQRLLTEIQNRLKYLVDVGLGYLTLDRLSSTLSGGESQRINLSTSLGSSLTGSLYILDEPSIGLHPRDTQRLVAVLRQLRDLGNTVIVVEHEEEVIRSADQIIDIGPEAGFNGGEIVYSGGIKGLEKAKSSLTADYLTGRKSIATAEHPRGWSNYIEVKGARENNLKGIDVKIPLGVMTVVTGVSGSGKSSLVKGILYPALRREILETGTKPGNFAGLDGDIRTLRSVEIVDQNPIGKSSRSNPVTYIKAYDEIRKLFADQPYARNNSMTPSHFSFNIAGGRCEQCQGEGIIKVGMQFMADVEIKCDACGGKRFKDEILEVRYHDRTINDVLDMTVDQAVEFFSRYKGATNKRIAEKLKALQDVGLGYVKLGQSSSTLSGGESQRVKLASFLLKENTSGNTMFIFDEPTTGLHFHDIKKLLASFQALIEKGHTIVVVEHNMDMIKSADWVIDLGPEAGEAGGSLVYEGTPAGLARLPVSHTGRYLARYFNNG